MRRFPHILPLRLGVALLLCGGAALAQTSPAAPPATFGSTTTPAPVTSLSLGSQNPLFGSVPRGQPTAEVLQLTPLDAIDRGLKYNLGLLLSDYATEAARGARWRALSDLLPNLTTRTAETVQQVNLKAMGITLPAGFPDIVGPFSVFDTRAALSAPLLDLKALNKARARKDDIRASQLTYRNARDLVVLVVGAAYMQALAGDARVKAVEAELATARRLYQRAVDMKATGIVAGIDVLRAQVEMQSEQQRLTASRNDQAKQKLALARLIGLPVGQQFTLTDDIPLTPARPLTLEEALQRAYRDRPDYQAAHLALLSAQWSRKSAAAGALPSLQFNADYGIIGRTPGSSHGTFTTVAALKIPIFQGGKVKGEVMEANALLRRRQAELDDLRGRIEFEVRTAFLDMKAAWEQVEVARSSVDLAQQALTQAQDRFAAGVTSNIEVVQAQESVAASNENYINSVFGFNVSKLEMARALGTAEQAVKDFLGGKP
jgi:outer membrane protein TolC